MTCERCGAPILLSGTSISFDDLKRLCSRCLVSGVFVETALGGAAPPAGATPPEQPAPLIYNMSPTVAQTNTAAATITYLSTDHGP